MRQSTRIGKSARILAAAAVACAVAAGTAGATPSTIVWIPSVDLQSFRTLHVTYDTYLRAKRNPDGSRSGAIVDLGLTAGVLPFEKVQAEAGFDLVDQPDPLGTYPLTFNAKVGSPEGAWFKGSPALAVGGYNFGTKSGDVRVGEAATNMNVAYAIAGKTVPVLGRFEAGWYVGNRKVLIGPDGGSDEKGVLLSWDRTLSEISDKLWVGVDYQGGDTMLGALNFGASWAFAKNVSIIFGYDVYTRKATGGQNTYTVQLDINIP